MSEFERQKLYGWEKFLHNMYMILTFPVRRWWIILSILATVLLVLIIIPTIHGIKKEDIFDWYKAKLMHSDIYKAKNKTIALISKKVDNLKNNISKTLPDSQENSTVNAKKKKESDLVAWNIAEFKKAKYIPHNNTAAKNKETENSNTFAAIKEHIKQLGAEQNNSAKTSAQQNEIFEIGEKKRPLTDYYDVRKDLNLEYLNDPETVSGTAIVSGPNELYIDDTFVYLYGIYTNPHKYDIEEVKMYLEDIMKNQTIECDIVAYSIQTQARTALCFVNGVLLNRQMVIEDMADNIALKME